MEQITKQQVILIALLVAIITAISTSVATVSLLDNPYSSSGQTIYKVIEKSIETVANIPTTKDTDTTAKPIPVSSEISPSDIAASGAKSIVRIYEKIGGEKKFAALGAAFGSKNGVIASALLVDKTESSEFVAVTSENREVKATITKSDLPGRLTFFVLNYEAGEKSKVPSLEIKSVAAQKLGTNVVALGGKESGNVVSTGIIMELAALEGSSATTTDVMITDMALSSSISGWLLFDKAGSIIGFEMGSDDARVGRFLSASIIKSALAGLL